MYSIKMREYIKKEEDLVEKKRGSDPAERERNTRDGSCTAGPGQPVQWEQDKTGRDFFKKMKLIEI